MLRISLIASVVSSAGAFLFLSFDNKDFVLSNDHAIEQAVITGSAKLTKGSAVVAGVSGGSQQIAENPVWLDMSEVGVIAGIAGVALGFAVNTYFQWRKDRRDKYFQERRDQREQEVHDLAVSGMVERRKR